MHQRLSRLPLKSGFQFDRVTFCYPTARAPVLNDLSVLIPANSVIGIAGTTGAGKSTMLDMLLGLLQPTTGELRIDNVLLSPSHIRAWQRNIGYVWVPIELAEPGTVLAIESERGHLTGRTAAIPFVDPKKEVPAAPLRS